MRRVHHISTVLRLADRALQSGATRRSLTSVSWNVAGRCERPAHLEIAGNTGPLWAERGSSASKRAMTVELDLRCRHCGPCLRARAILWRNRARAEIAASVRTWFGTLTLKPDEHLRAGYRAAERTRTRRCEDFEILSEDEQFAARHAAIGPELTKYLKRLRKSSGASMRYLLVVEPHQNRLPHYHMLIHELSDVPVKHALLTSNWTLGFTKWKLVNDDKAAAYVAKYLAKSAAARVRASARYGSPEPISLSNRSQSGPCAQPMTHPPTLYPGANIAHLGRVTERGGLSGQSLP